MLFLKFRNSSGDWTIGPAASIEFRGAEMFLPNSALPAARFHGGGWTQDGKRCTYVECRAKLDPLAGAWCQTDTREHWPRMHIAPVSVFDA